MTTATAPMPKLLVDRYEVVRELGRGSMGVVYECVDRMLGRRAAVKVVPVDGSRGVVRARAQREQLALGRLKSPHIVWLFDLVDTGDELYFVYEFVDGSSLDRIATVFSVADALRIAIAVASALADAHRAGFIHRDIKPSNVIVPRGAGGELDYEAAKLLDFGVAGALTKRDHGAVTTMAGEIFGSPLYMSPEQVQGKAQSAAADVYGVGALLFQLVYGRTVFEGASFTQLLLQIMSAKVSYPDAPDVPEALRALIERCLAKDPTARYPDGSALLEALNNVARGTISGFAPVARGASQKLGPSSAAPPQASAVSSLSPPRAAVSDGPTARRVLVPELARPRSHKWRRIVAAVGGVVVLGLVVFFGPTWSAPESPSDGIGFWLVAGVAASWLAAFFVHRAIEKRRVPLAGTVAAVLGHAHAVEDLSKSLALDVEQLLEVCRSLDQHMLAKTLALMIGEYDKARESEDRQAALMKAVELMEKLHEKLAPWYVKRQTVLTWGVGVVGSVFSAAKTLGELFELLHK